MIKTLTIVVAVIGLAVGIWVAATNKPKLPNPPPDQPPAVNPFPNGIAALGFIEASTREIEIGPPHSGLVVEVFTSATDRVNAGQPLFALDDRDLQADRISARAAAVRAEADLARLKSMPRAEDVAPARAKVAETDAWLADAERKYKSVQDAAERRAATPEEIEERRMARDAAKAVADAAQAELDRILAGAWSEDIAVAQAEIDRLNAAVKAIEFRIDRLTVRAPISGEVLRRDIEPGEFVSPGVGAPPFILADLSGLNVRAQVDEEDMPLLREGAEAVAQLRGPTAERVRLRMLRIEPLARKKTQISGSNTELIDTRVVDVVFEVTGRADGSQGPLPRLLPGQAVDVFIRSEVERGSATAEAAASANPPAPSPSTGG